ncbi:MAG: ROK family protein [bacterium]
MQVDQDPSEVRYRMPSNTRNRRQGRHNYAVVLDVGGTFVKSAVVASNGTLLPETYLKLPSISDGTADEIMGCLAETIRMALYRADIQKLPVCGIGLCIPGPFDYNAGISFMRHKFKAIRGLKLRQALAERLCISKETSICFESDAHAFLLGEVWKGNAQGAKRITAVTLGTGLGAAFVSDGKILRRDSRTPLHSIWSLPYEEGIVEDRISREGIIARYKELRGEASCKQIDVKDIAHLAAKEKDMAGLQVFEEIGCILGDVLAPLLEDFQAECLILGGQISKAFPLFSSPLQAKLEKIDTLKVITRGKAIDGSPLYGMAKLVFDNML